MKTTQFDIPGFDGNCTKVFSNGKWITKAVRCNSGRFSASFLPKNKVESSRFETETGISFTSVALKNQINKNARN